MAESAVSDWEHVQVQLAKSGWIMHTTSDYVMFTKHQQEEGSTMSDSARMRVVLDLPVDPSSASPRVINALAGEARDYVQVVLVKDREITLVDHVEVINTHVHVSTDSEACFECVSELAQDGRR